MKIGVHHLSNLGNSWNMSDGIPLALHRMGHSVEVNIQEDGERCPPEWSSLDFVIVAEADYVPPSNFSHLTCPKALWFTETENRVDMAYSYPWRMSFSPHCFFVGLQDAVKYQKTWLPHGIDTAMFRPLNTPKTINIGYYGSIYALRMKLWKQILNAKIPVTRIERVQCERRHSVELMVRDINHCKVMLALPAYSHSFTTRPLECFACGVPLVVPRLADFAQCNEAQWNVHPHYYDENNLDTLMTAVIEAMADNPAKLVKEAFERHSLEIRLQRIIDVVSGKIPVDNQEFAL